MNNIKIFLAIFLLLKNNNISFAVQESQPTAIDSRIRVMVYNPNDIFKFTGYYNYQASIEFALDEEIINISIGDTTSWQIVPNGHRIFLKPIESNATTNMTLITNKRTYYFELYAEEATNIRDPGMAFNVKFLYPELEQENNIKITNNHNVLPDTSAPENLNFNYMISGSEEIAPIKIYDDGEFTYMQFRNKNKTIPAIFSVDENLLESIVNYRLDPHHKNLIIIEQVFQKYTLRSGSKITCVYNEAFIPY